MFRALDSIMAIAAFGVRRDRAFGTGLDLRSRYGRADDREAIESVILPADRDIVEILSADGKCKQKHRTADRKLSKHPKRFSIRTPDCFLLRGEKIGTSIIEISEFLQNRAAEEVRNGSGELLRVIQVSGSKFPAKSRRRNGKFIRRLSSLRKTWTRR